MEAAWERWKGLRALVGWTGGYLGVNWIRAAKCIYGLLYILLEMVAGAVRKSKSDIFPLP